MGLTNLSARKSSIPSPDNEIRRDGEQRIFKHQLPVASHPGHPQDLHGEMVKRHWRYDAQFRLFDCAPRTPTLMSSSLQKLQTLAKQDQQYKNPDQNPRNACRPGVCQIEGFALRTSNLSLATGAPNGSK